MFSPPTGPFDLRTISLGAGVQSTTVALLAARGELTPMPDCAIFADTQAEPGAVYRHLEWLEGELPFPVHRVTAGDLGADIEESTRGGRYAGAPFFTTSETGRAGRLRKICTVEYKVEPLEREQRRLLGFEKGQRIAGKARAEVWIGISMDEIGRAKPAKTPWVTKRFPLIELRWSRADCLRWLAEQGYPEPPRSACVFCPNHSNHEWKLLRDNDPDGWSRALEIDDLIRGGVRGTTEDLYLHRQLVPLQEADLRSAEEMGQQTLWDDECEGMCGV